MANQPPRSGASKDKDDDSWGKLASDLFGIQFGKADDDDFDLPDDESASTSPPPELKSVPTLADVLPVTATVGSIPVDEPDLSFPEEEEPTEPAPKPSVKPKIPAEPIAQAVAEQAENEPVRPQVESEKDIWDLLESWNWDEAPRDANHGRSTQESRPSDSRAEGGRASGQRRGDRDSRRERSPDRGGERPGRPGGVEATSEGEESRPRREERPRRADAPERDRQRSERPARTEERERRPERSVPARDTTGPKDDFATGLDEEASRPQPVRERPKSAPRRPSPPPQPSAPPVDGFDDDLFVELEAIQPDEGIEDAADFDESSTETPTGEERPRRRRRRRRGVRNRRDDVSRTGATVEESMGSAEVVESSDDDLAAVEPEETLEVSPDEGEREPRRRRKRRRVRRRGEESTERTEIDLEAEEEEIDEASVAEREPADEDLFEDEEEQVVAVSYEGIPSWEEAISYLQRRPRESRPRGDGPSRGRGGSHRR